MRPVIDPFTRTPGIAGDAYIDMHYADDIISLMENEQSSKYVFKIVGLRGSGKSVVYSKIINHFKNNDRWVVCTLSAAGNVVNTLVSLLSKESDIDETKQSISVSTNASVNGNIGILGGEINGTVTKTKEYNDKYYSEEAELVTMVKKINAANRVILVGIDDISKTHSTVELLSILGNLLLNGYKIYLICTGLSKNIEDFSKEDNLTFFKRSDLIEIGSLSQYEIAYMYKELLGVDSNMSAILAKFVKGYAYAYQVMGSLYYNKKENEGLEDLVPKFERIIFRDSYDLIWKSLTPAEQELVVCILKSETGSVESIKQLMEKPANFPSLRNRLENKHVVDTETRGIIKINLPQFKEFVEMWT